MKRFLFLLLTVLLTGCARRPVHTGIDYLVGKECNASARLLGCDQASPPKCRQIVLRYAKGCEELQVEK